MIAVAVLLLPLLGLLLCGMDRVEDRLTGRPSDPRHASRRLRLIPGGRQHTAHHAARRQHEQQSRAA
ncbi:hypothetical protein ABZ402_45270 [Streptomyces mirabilis]|uniref:hypothetical protein n=1 Tax=Streptomyces mirabilis TaxID=68239 RepID=UPI00340EB4DA